MNVKKWMMVVAGLFSMMTIGCADSSSSVTADGEEPVLYSSGEMPMESSAGAMTALSSSEMVPEQLSSAKIPEQSSSSGVPAVSASDFLSSEALSSETQMPMSSVVMSSSIVQMQSSSSMVQQSSPSVSSAAEGNGSFDSMFFGAWVGGTEETPQPSAANVAAFEKLQDRHLDVISVFSLWQYNDWNWTRTYADIAKQNGSILLVTWMPTPYTAADILSGKCDSYIDDFARGVKDFGEEIWLRPLHEANGDWYTWGTGKDGVNNSSDKVAEAFRYIVKRFRAIGVPNVKWVWTTNASNSGAGTSLTGAYPGDEYVDYNSIDGYNWGAAQSWSSWQSFSTVFSEAYKALSAYDKPMFIAEFASTEKGGNKAEWINEMFRDLPTKFPKIVGLMWFSQSKEENEGDWALNTSDAAVEAWKTGLRTYPAAQRLR